MWGHADVGLAFGVGEQAPHDQSLWRFFYATCPLRASCPLKSLAQQQDAQQNALGDRYGDSRHYPQKYPLFNNVLRELSGGGSDSGAQLSLSIDAWSLVVPSENANKASQAIVDM